jgi:drug/metabolite transporter (DMT)-like permease
MMVLAAAVLFSTGGAAVKLCSLTGWQVACFRSAMAATVIAILIPGARRGWTAKTWLVGASYAATMILYVLANKLTTAANAIFLQGTAPLYVVLLGPLLLDEKVDRRQMLTMAVMAAGMALFFVGRQPAVGSAPEPMSGNLLGAAAGLSWALVIMGLRWLARDETSSDTTIAAVACGNLLATALTLPMAFPLGPSNAADWAVVGFLGVFQIGVAYAFLVRGVVRVPAMQTSLLLLAEPVLSPLWAWLVHGEVPTSWAMLGGAVILGATAVMALARAGNEE